VGFEIVKVCAGAVDRVRDVVAGAVGKVFAETSSADHVAGGIVGLESANRAAGGEGLFDRGDGGIAGVADGLKHKLLALGRRAANDAGPRDVVVNRVGPVELAPDIDEQEVALADGRGVVGAGIVV